MGGGGGGEGVTRGGPTTPPTPPPNPRPLVGDARGGSWFPRRPPPPRGAANVREAKPRSGRSRRRRELARGRKELGFSRVSRAGYRGRNMWDPRAFERLWRAEFPGAEAPALRLETARDVERELERCSLNLARLQQVLAQERFKASHLRALLAGEGRAEAGDPREPRDPEAAVPRAGRSWAAAVHRQLLQPLLRFRAQEDEMGAGGDSETLDQNEESALGPWLAAPCGFRMRGEEAEERPGRESSPHRGTPPTPGAPRPPRWSPDLEQLEVEAEESPGLGAGDHLPGWRRQRFLPAPERDSPAHSSPERDSDESRHSSDREDGFSAGGRPVRSPRPLARPSLDPPLPPPHPPGR
ncbi:hypothetical protein P7K49_010188 [Saguinus oedipus]|uniref:Bcr-Abl oncoprotein oligomerisation domain-containing protein n=1 Tax=Saguinus oedipus TaxID=9490 RepID=A0ABQ9VMK6_SAGOE|nr:hypothetical protein P7K49_010188 [Saguinus oedipus]